MSKNNKTYIDNLKLTLDIAKQHLTIETERCARLDNKLNFLLVFLAALIAGGLLLFPLPLVQTWRIVSLVLLIELFILIFCAALMILLGMYPKQNLAIDANNFCDVEIISRQHDALLANYIASLTESIKTYRNTNEKKGKYMRTAFILSIVALIIFCVLIVLKAI